MKFSRSYLGVFGVILAAWSTAYALQWTSVEAVLRPQADGAMPVASYPFRARIEGQALGFGVMAKIKIV
jgi:hypothetical protein